MSGAITREKQIKKWPRAWKPAPIEKANPQWRDPHDDFPQAPPPTLLRG
jgi:putative endonuclease